MSDFLQEAWTILQDGGWLMYILILLSLAAYGLALDLIYYLKSHDFYKIGREDLARAVDREIEPEEELQGIINYLSEGDDRVEEVTNRSRELRECYLGKIDRQVLVITALINIAPLLGLLGTVGGMLTTFSGLSVNTAGQTVDLIAGGISEALITTQTGLTIAIPGYLFIWQIIRRRSHMDSCLSSLETLTLIAKRKQLKAA